MYVPHSSYYRYYSTAIVSIVMALGFALYLLQQAVRVVQIFRLLYSNKLYEYSKYLDY